MNQAPMSEEFPDEFHYENMQEEINPISYEFPTANLFNAFSRDARLFGNPHQAIMRAAFHTTKAKFEINLQLVFKKMYSKTYSLSAAQIMTIQVLTRNTHSGSISDEEIRIYVQALKDGGVKEANIDVALKLKNELDTLVNENVDSIFQCNEDILYMKLNDRLESILDCSESGESENELDEIASEEHKMRIYCKIRAGKKIHMNQIKGPRIKTDFSNDNRAYQKFKLV